MLTEAVSMVAQHTLHNLKKIKKIAPGATNKRMLGLKKRCTVNLTEVTVATVMPEVNLENLEKKVKADIFLLVVLVQYRVKESMEAVAVSKIELLKYPLFQKVKILLCYLIISVLMHKN